MLRGIHKEIECLRIDFHVCMTWQFSANVNRWNPWKLSLRHSVFNRGFSNFKVYSVSHSHCHSHPHPHTLTLKPEHSQCQTKPTHSHRHSQCQTKPEHSKPRTPTAALPLPRTPTAALPLRTASRAYSTWNKWPSGEILQSAR